MASKRKSLSVVEFLEDVCADGEPTQNQDYTFDEVLKTSVASFRVLNGEFEDYGRFREAAKRSLTACYEQHRTEKGSKAPRTDFEFVCACTADDSVRGACLA